jgi:hypothetical protein
MTPHTIPDYLLSGKGCERNVCYGCDAAVKLNHETGAGLSRCATPGLIAGPTISMATPQKSTPNPQSGGTLACVAIRAGELKELKVT